MGPTHGGRKDRTSQPRWLVVVLLVPAAMYAALMVWAVADADGFSLLFCEHPAADSTYGDPVVRFPVIDCRWGVAANGQVVAPPDARDAIRTTQRPAFPTLRWVAAASLFGALALAIYQRARRRAER